VQSNNLVRASRNRLVLAGSRCVKSSCILSKARQLTGTAYCIAILSRAAQPRDSPRDSPRARCCYTFSVLHHTLVGPDLRQRDATILRLGLEEQDEGTSRRQPSVSHALTHRQAATEISTSSTSSTSSASAEPAAAVAHGLEVVAESTNPTVEYASRCSFARSQLTRLQYRRRQWPERNPRAARSTYRTYGCLRYESTT
jgi:hypothetical protein